MMRSMSILPLLAWLMASPAHAWTQRFIERDVGNFDHFQIWMFDDARFEMPSGIDRFNRKKAGWRQTFNNGRLLIADGAPVDSLGFRLRFADSKKTGFSFAFQAWSGNRLVDDATVTWDPRRKRGKRWVITDGSAWIRTRIGSSSQMAVAEPSTFLLAGLGLLILALVRARSLRQLVSGRIQG